MPVRAVFPGSSARRAGFLGLVVLLSAAYLAAPEGIGGLAFFGTAVAGMTTFIVGPLVRRPANARPWRWLGVSGVFFLAGLLLRLLELDVPGPLGVPDVWTFGGYACMALFLFGLLRQTRTTGPEPTLWLDTAIVAWGSVLIGWVVNVAPGLTGPEAEVVTTLVNTAYPVGDTILLTLALQLGFRRGADTPALQAGLVGIGALLVGDLAYTFVWAVDPGSLSPVINVAYIVSYAYLGVMAAHPSMGRLSDVVVPHRPKVSRKRLGLVLVAMLVPAVLPISTPTQGWYDGVVRGLLMAGFVTLVFLRLLRTIHALQAAEAVASYRATHDALSGLPNRVALLDTLADRPDGTAVLLVDCDHFQQINDSWGHAAGDEVLLRVADRLQSVAATLGTPAELARMGGDEFALRLGSGDQTAAVLAADRILAAFTEPVTIGGDRSTLLTLSIGVATAEPDDGVAPEDLLRNADLALYQAKTAGRATSVVFDSSMHDLVSRRLRLADDLRGALDRGEIHLQYQQIRGGPGYGQLAGWEALARWDHPELGPVSPFEFIPIAEDTGAILGIGEFALRSATQQLRRWHDRFGRTDLHVSVNVSSLQLVRTDLVGMVRSALEDAGVPPTSLWVEITESVELDNAEDALSVLKELTALGVKLCMDDFGTGYSSLSYLKSYRLHVLKIDKAFVRDIVTDARDRELSRAMIDVAGALQLEAVVAEGVETQDQADALAALGCSHVQGYYFARPARVPEAEAAAAQVLATPAVPVPRPAT